MTLYYGRAIPPKEEWGGRLPVALIFPERMEHALSTLGWQVVYRLLASRGDVVVERFFWDPSSPRPRSVDSGRDLGLFPLLLFSLNFEGDFENMLRMLKNAHIPLRSTERSDWPAVMVGGPISFLNPCPILPACDALWVGEAEAGLHGVFDEFVRSWVDGNDKRHALSQIIPLQGVLVPGQSVEPVKRQIHTVEGKYLSDPAYSCFISSEAQFRDMLLLEVNRGCPYGCRFCAAGSIYKPPRHAKLDELKEIVERTAPHKVGLIGTALTDWSDLHTFLSWLHERKIKFSLASLRADGLTEEFLEFLRRTGTRTITLALEGASSRLRKAMNKHFSEEIFLEAVRKISAFQFNTLKLYMITGWPGENEDDWTDFAMLLERIDAARKEGQAGRGKGVELITLSVSCLIPKPWTPLQWAPMADEKWLKSAMKRFKFLVGRYKGMRFTGENPQQAKMQAFLAKGGEEIFDCLADASEIGLPAAMREHDALVEKVLHRVFTRDERLPWEKIDVGVRRSFLYSEWTKYHKELMTPPCPAGGCADCKICGMERWS